MQTNHYLLLQKWIFNILDIFLCEHQLEVRDSLLQQFLHQTNWSSYKSFESNVRVFLFEQNVTQNIRPKNETYSLFPNREPSPIKNHLCKLSHIFLPFDEAKPNLLYC